VYKCESRLPVLCHGDDDVCFLLRRRKSTE